VKAEESISIISSKYLLGESTHEELQEAISFFGDSEMNQNIESILDVVWNSDQFTIPKQHESKNLHSILQQIHEKIEPEFIVIRREKARRVLFNIARIAAVLVFGMVLGIGINTFRKTDPITLTSKAPKGSIAQMILPDSTMVYLNSGSELKYTHKGSKRIREVFLDGEALFQVNENKNRPFVVHTSAYDVKVTGTEFNVKAYSDDKEIVTTLVSGSVIIPSTDQFRMSSDKILSPGQQLLYNRENHSVSTTNVDTRYFTSWTDNKLIFINMSLKGLVILLERKYGVDIEVKDKSILNYHYDGTITNESILKVMELLKVTLPIQYRIVGQTIQITKRTGGL
jgi:transmembrane sensor